MIRRNLLVAASLLSLAGCTQVPVVLWTDLPSMAAVVEEFNASQNDHIVQLEYQSNIGQNLRLAETPPDLVVSRYIEDRSTAALFQPLDGLLGKSIDADAFYPALLANGGRDGKQRLLPVSFDLPLIYYVSTVPVAGQDVVVDPDELKETAGRFNQGNEERWTHVGYSPLWETDFLYQYARVFGLSVREGSAGAPGWSFETLMAFLKDARDWVDEANGGIQRDSEFQDRYLYEPQIQSVKQGRVRYGYDTLAGFFALSDARRRGLGSRWFGDGGQIRVLEGISYAGIPAGAPSRRGTERFLEWFFQVDTQVEVIESGVRKRISQFGLAGGLSSLWRVNERYLPEIYPELDGKVPTAARLQFPDPAPRHWGTLVTEVVRPWLLRELSGQPQARDLEDSVRAWLLQQEE